MIYFAQAQTPDGRGPVKIGYAGDNWVRERIDVLRTGCPWELKVLRLLPGDRREEKSLHRKFAEFRIRTSGEWFEYHPGIVALILATESAQAIIDYEPKRRGRERPPGEVVSLADRRRRAS